MEPADLAAAAPPSAPPAAAELLALPSAATHDLVYCCRRCRRPLFSPHNLAAHEAGQHAFAYRRAAKERAHATADDDASGAGGGSGGGVNACTSYFLLDALQWMEVRARESHAGGVQGGARRRNCSGPPPARLGPPTPTRDRPPAPAAWPRPRPTTQEASSDVEGKLCCPKCAVRVGTLKWAGSQCSCGTWVTPALQVYKKVVDERYFPKGTVEASLRAATKAGGPTDR